MKRLCAKSIKADWNLNIPVSYIERDESFVYGYDGENLVAVIDLGSIDVLWVSQMNTGLK